MKYFHMQSTVYLCILAVTALLPAVGRAESPEELLRKERAKRMAAEARLQAAVRNLSVMDKEIAELRAKVAELQGKKRVAAKSRNTKVPEKVKRYFKESLRYKEERVDDLQNKIDKIASSLEDLDPVTKRQKERVLEDLQCELEMCLAAKPCFEIGPPLGRLKVGKIGHTVRDRMVQVIDGKSILADVQTSTSDESEMELVWVEGYPTSGLNDYSKIDLPLVEVVGVKRYTTAKGTEREVFRLRPVAVRMYEAQLTRLIDHDALAHMSK